MNYTPNFWITGASMNSDKLVLTVNGTPLIEDFKVYRFLFAPNVQVPSASTNATVTELSIDGTEYPLWDKFGMPLTLGEIPVFSSNGMKLFQIRRVVVAGVGSVEGNSHFSVWNLPQPDSVIFPLNQQ